MAAHVRGPLLAPENGVLANGVFGYGPSGTFPTHSYNASNYWVDVMFEVGADPAPAGVAAVLPVSGDTAVAS